MLELSPETLNMIAAYGPIVVMVVIFYYFIYRPQKKEQQRKTDMLNNLKKGDRVVTNSGILGTVTAFSPKSVTLKVSDKVEIEFLRSAINDYQKNIGDNQ